MLRKIARRAPSKTGERQPCRKGNFFVLLADRDHVLFEYVPRETSAAVATMFHGYAGYVQADAKSVHDILFREPESEDEDAQGCNEVGCWAHCRRKFYEAAIAKDRVAREALFRIHLLFKNDRAWSQLPPAKRKVLTGSVQRIRTTFAGCSAFGRAIRSPLPVLSSKSTPPPVAPRRCQARWPIGGCIEVTTA